MVTKYGIYLQMWDAFNMEKPTAFVKKERLPYPKSSASFPVHRVWTYQDNAQIEPRTQLAMKMAGGESGDTYEFGYKQAVKTTKAKVSLYENVRDAASSLRDSAGCPCKPAVDVIGDVTRLWLFIFDFPRSQIAGATQYIEYA